MRKRYRLAPLFDDKAEEDQRRRCCGYFAKHDPAGPMLERCAEIRAAIQALQEEAGVKEVVPSAALLQRALGVLSVGFRFKGGGDPPFSLHENAMSWLAKWARCCERMLYYAMRWLRDTVSLSDGRSVRGLGLVLDQERRGVSRFRTLMTDGREIEEEFSGKRTSVRALTDTGMDACGVHESGAFRAVVQRLRLGCMVQKVFSKMGTAKKEAKPAKRPMAAPPARPAPAPPVGECDRGPDSGCLCEVCFAATERAYSAVTGPPDG